MYNTLYNNVLDYRNFSSFPLTPSAVSRSAPAFLNVAKAAKPSFLSKLGSSFSLSKISTAIGNAQKVLNIYNQVSPIVKQAKPIIDNLRTTLKVAKAFKKFSNEDSLEKAFDNLPDYQGTTSENSKKEEIIKEEENPSSDYEQKEASKPYFVV